MAITQILRGDSSGAVKAIQDLNKAIDQTEKGYQESTKEAKQLERAARRVGEQADPQRKYNRQVEELAKLVRTGRVELSDAERVAQKYGQRLDRAGESGRRAFGDNAARSIRNLALQYVSLSQAVSQVTQAFNEAESAAQSAADAIAGGLGAQGEVQQLAPAVQPKVNAFARRLIQTGVVAPGNRDLAFAISLNAQNAGFSEAEKNLLLEIGANRFVRPEALSNFGGSLKKVQDIFGVQEAGQLEFILDKIVTAANESQSTASEVLGAIPTVASAAKALGITDEETFAAIVGTEKESENINQAKTRLRAFLTRIDKAELTVNRDITDTVRALQGQVQRGEVTEAELFPDVEGLAGFRALRNQLATVEGIDTSLRTGARGAFRRQAGLAARNDPAFRAGLRKAEAEGRLAIFRESTQAERELLYDAFSARAQQYFTERFGAGGAALLSIPQRMFDVLGGEEILFRRALETNRGYLGESLQEDLRDYLKRSAEASERTADAIEKRPSPPLTTGRQE